MKPFLILYDTDHNGSKNLLILIYADIYENAVIKLKEKINTNNVYGTINITKIINLTVE